MTQKDITVYIGRFSPFHKGHAYILEQALQTSKLVIVLIGSSGQARSLKNPFTYDERREMIESWQAAEGVGFDKHGLTKLVIAPLQDSPYNDALWMRQVQSKVRSITKKFCIERDLILTDVFLTGSNRDDSTWYLNAFPQWTLSLVPPYRQNGVLNISATDVRRWMFDGTVPDGELDHIPDALPMSTFRFLMEFMKTPGHEALRTEYRFVQKYKADWAVAPYAPTFVTVDAVVVQSGHVLVVERGHQPGKGLWALPGGFLNQNERLRDGAIRELIEETGISLAEGKRAKEITEAMLKGSIRENQVFDAPDRSSRGRTITTAFLIRLDDTKPLPKVKGTDDAADAFWVPISEALDRSSKWFEDHHAIVTTLIGTKDL
jgi:bifunctional NMN adenylyltransferase/nudix hydrolase